MHPQPNPVLAGCHPDPSICRAGEDYYLVTSTFAFHPGLPVHRSRDLTNWQLVGHVLTEDTRGLEGLDISDGVWAPTIRHYDGLFYVIWGEARGRRWSQTFVSTAEDAAGPWSTPVPLDAEGIDPSLFFDDDGRCWFTAARDADKPVETGPAELWMREFDYRAMRLVGPSYSLWHGAVRGAWVEAPHIFKHEGRYHLIGAEGGTERNHAVTAAQSDRVTGPYRTDPRSPLLTHRHLGETAPVQNLGHLDLVDTPDGGIAAVALGVRPIDGYHVLGREVFLVPARWSAEGLLLAPGSGKLEPSAPAPAPSGTDWLSLRGPIAWRETPAGIVINARPEPLHGLGRPAMLARRQLDHRFSFSTLVEAPRVQGQHTGIVAFQNQERWVRVSLERNPGGLRAIASLRSDGAERTLATVNTDEIGARLQIESDARSYRLVVLTEDNELLRAEVPHSTLSTEDAGGFVGVLLGLLNEGPESAGEAEFVEVDYRATPTSEAAVDDRLLRSAAG